MAAAGPLYRGPLDDLLRDTHTDREDSVTSSDFDSLFNEPRMGQQPSKNSKGKQPIIVPARRSFRAPDTSMERSGRERSVSPDSRPYQVRADRANRKRDRSDGDYTPEKRARTETTGSAGMSADIAIIEPYSEWWKERVQHKSFNKLHPDAPTKGERLNCIAAIEQL